MKVRTPMDSGINALILGFFAASWFNWGRADASGALKTTLGIGIAVALIPVSIGVVRIFRRPRSLSALEELGSGRRFGQIAGIEFGAIFLGMVVLGIAGDPVYSSAWACAVVGVHFFPLAPVVNDPALRWLGAVIAIVAVAAVLTGVLTGVAPSSVVGPGAGLALLVFSITVLAGPTRPGSPAPI